MRISIETRRAFDAIAQRGPMTTPVLAAAAGLSPYYFATRMQTYRDNKSLKAKRVAGGSGQNPLIWDRGPNFDEFYAKMLGVCEPKPDAVKRNITPLPYLQQLARETLAKNDATRTAVKRGWAKR